MRNRSNRIVVILAGCLLLCTAACRAVESAPQNPPAPSEAPVAEIVVMPEPTIEPTAAPTPVAVNGCVAENGVLRVVADADDFALIEQIPDLRVLDVSGSGCYDAILAYRNAHPGVTVLYSVAIGNSAIASDAETATVPRVPNPALLSYLPALKALNVTEPMTPGEAAALRAALPDALLSYSVSFAGLTVSSDAPALDLSGVSPALSAEIAEGLAALPNVLNVELNRSDGTSGWTLSDAGVLQAVRPSLRVDLNITAFDRTFSLTDDVIDLNRVRMDEERKAELLALLPYLRSAGRLDMEYSGLSDEEMAALREQFPSPKIVWRIRAGKYSCRTDAIMIRFSVHRDDMTLHARDVRSLIYCNEIRYLDLGHNDIQDPYFVACMPDLEVCILAAGQPTDLSAFANCTHLEYAEFFTGKISDLSPLRNCTELRHLNLCGNHITDITPLYGLTHLERLWISNNKIPQEQIDRFKELVPDCVVVTEGRDPTGNGWRNDPSRESTYAERYELLRKQFCYDTNVNTYSVPPDSR